MPLAMVETGRKVKLVSVNAGHGLVGRLISMGLVPGMEIEVIRNASQGALIVSAGGSRIMLGRGMAQKIQVK
jgi:ferrous iron transport protein A